MGSARDMEKHLAYIIDDAPPLNSLDRATYISGACGTEVNHELIIGD